MLITDDIYYGLSKRIEAGEFLVSSKKDDGTESEEMPSLPEPNNSDEADYHEKCQQTIDLYAKKVEALYAQMASVNLIVQEKEATDRVNSLVKNFDFMLEQQYNKYKAEAEQTILQLKNDLNQMKSVAQDALQRNKELSQSYKNLEDVNRKLKVKLDELEGEQSNVSPENFHQDLMNGKSQSIKVAKLLKELKEKKNRIDQQQLEFENERKKISDFAKEIVHTEVKRLSNIELIPDGKTGEVLHIEKSLIERLVNQIFTKYLPQSESLIGELRLDITGVITTREKAELDKIRKKSDASTPAKVAPNQVNISLGGEQKNTLGALDATTKRLVKMLSTDVAKEDEQ